MSEETPIRLNNDIERLIVRQLDGAATEDEALFLQKEIMRNPAARQLLEDYGRIDEVAQSCLKSVLGEAPTFDVDSLSVRRVDGRQTVRPYSRAWWCVPTAIAASLLWVAFSGLPKPNGTSQLGLQNSFVQRPASSAPQQDVGPHQQAGFSDSPENMAPRRVLHDVDRNLIGLLGDDGKIYWFEVDRVRTFSGVNPQGVRLARGDM